MLSDKVDVRGTSRNVDSLAFKRNLKSASTTLMSGSSLCKDIMQVVSHRRKHTSALLRQLGASNMYILPVTAYRVHNFGQRSLVSSPASN